MSTLAQIFRRVVVTAIGKHRLEQWAKALNEKN